jgi:hypothetical protein
VRAPLLLWGPYLWADGLIPRADGLTWVCQDFATDGIHPNNQGSRKVAQMLFDFFRSDPSAAPWFTVGRSQHCGIPADVDSVGQGTKGVRGVPQLTSVRLPVPGASLGLRVTGAAGDAPVFLLFGVVPSDTPFLGGRIYLEPVWILEATADRHGLVEFAVGQLPADPLLSGIPVRWQALVVDDSNPHGAALAPALVTRFGN